MAGRGPAPKDPAKRARTNKDPVPLRIVEIEPVAQPELPDFSVSVEVDGELVSQSFEWPPLTREWWGMLSLHPLSHEFIEADWAFLMETARIHAEFWSGKMNLAGELRLREAKYGFTPEDRARLRIQFAQASSAEDDAKQKRARSPRGRFDGIAVEPA